MRLIAAKADEHLSVDQLLIQIFGNDAPNVSKEVPEVVPAKPIIQSRPAGEAKLQALARRMNSRYHCGFDEREFWKKELQRNVA